MKYILYRLRDVDVWQSTSVACGRGMQVCADHARPTKFCSMTFISERSKEDRWFGTNLEKGEVIRGEDLFFSLENTTN